RSPRGVTRDDTDDLDRRRERLQSSKSEDSLSREDKPSDSGGDQWSSVLQNRYGRSLKDTTKTSRSEDDVFRFDHYATKAEENSTAAVVSTYEAKAANGQTNSQTNLDSELQSSETNISSEVITSDNYSETKTTSEVVTSEIKSEAQISSETISSDSKSVNEASTSGSKLAFGVNIRARSSFSDAEASSEEDQDISSGEGARHASDNQTKANNAHADWRKERAAILGRSGLRHSQSEDDAPTKVQHRFEDVATLQSHWSPPSQYNQSQAAKTIKDESNVAETKRTQTYNKISNSAEQLSSESEVVECKESLVSLVEKKEHADLIVSESVVLKDSAKEKDIERKHESLTKSGESVSQRFISSSSVSQSETVRTSQREESSVVTSREELRLRKSKETTEEVNHRLKESISGQSTVPQTIAEKRNFFRREEAREERSEDSSTSSVQSVICRTEEDQKHTDVRLKSVNKSEDASEVGINVSLEEDKDVDLSSNKSEDGSAAPSEGGSVATSDGGSSVVVESLVIDTLSALKAETVYMSSSEDVSAHDDSRRDQSSISEDTTGVNPSRQDSTSMCEELVEDPCIERKDVRQQEEAPRYVEERLLNEAKSVTKEDIDHSEEPQQITEDLQTHQEPEGDDITGVRRRLFPDLIVECEAKGVDTSNDATKDVTPQTSQTESLAALDALIHGRTHSQSSSHAGSQPVTPRSTDQESQSQQEPQTLPAQVPEEKSVESQVTPQSPLMHTQISADYVTSPHIQLEETSLCEEPQTHVVQSKRDSHLSTEEEEIVYDHTVTSAQHKIQFCTTPVTVEGVLPRDDAEPDPLPPPIPPHGLEQRRPPPAYDTISTGSGETAVSSATEAEPTTINTAPTTSPAPEPMTADEAQRLLSANIIHQKRAGLLSDAEAHEVALLLSPSQDSPTSLQNSAPPVPPHYADVAPPVPPHYGPVEDEYDSRVASHFDPSLASPLSPEDAPSTPDSEISGDVLHVARVKEVLVEDGIHYLEDGHFWVEVPGLPENDEDDEFEPDLPYHAHTKLSFSQNPMQMFSTYSVSEYDRKNEDVDPVAASAEYELEKRVEKMDIFPVDIVKGDGGLGLSIIGMGVGADAGVEKLGIFVKTITSAGATETDGRIQVNDQIIEVDGKSLVGVTQVFAASVLKNTSGRVHFLIGREKDPDNSEVALLIKQSLQADREREERRRALGGPEYDPRIGQGLFDPLSSPSEENSRSEEVSSVQHNYASYMDAGGSSPTSPDAMSPPPEVFDMEGDTSDTSPDNDTALLRLKLKEGQYKHAMAEAEITKLKMKLVEAETKLLEQSSSNAELVELHSKVRDADEKLQAKLAEASTYQDMLEQSQGQFIVLEKKYYKAKKIIKEYQGRERDFLHREEYHITTLEEKDSHYNTLVKTLKDRVIQLEGELMSVQKEAGLPVGVPQDATTATYQLLHKHQHQQPKPLPATPPANLETEISDTENSDSANADDERANTVERKVAVKEELDQAVPPHELLDVSASRAKGELGMRGGLAGRHLPSLKKATSISSTSSQEQSIDEASMEDDLPEALKASAFEAPVHEGQEQHEDLSRIPAAAMQSPASPNQPPWMPTQPPPPYSQATKATTPTGAPPPYHHPPQQFATPIRPPHRTSDSPTSLPSWAHMGSEHYDPQRPEIPYRHPPPVAWVQPVNRAEISESSNMVLQQQQQHHLTAGRTPQQQSLAEQLKQLLAERETDSISQTPVKGQTDQCVRISRDASPSKPLPNSLVEDVRQAVMQADVSSTSLLGRKPIISGPVHLSSTAHVVPTGQMVAQAASPPQRSSNTSAVYSPGRESTTSPGSPRLGRSVAHGNIGVSANPAGVVLLSQRPLDQQQKNISGVDVGSGGELSSGPGSLGSGDEGSGASLGSQSSLCYPPQPTTERSKKSHMWQTAPVTDWTKEQVCQWLVVQGLEGCVGKFQSGGITGPRLLNLDARDLKNLALTSEEKNKIKRKVKELRLAVEKERKQVEKEKKEREKLMKKAEKLAKEAEKKKK
ncbi:unnamed protein product, partial [Meganyctiphanes norvegica]